MVKKVGFGPVWHSDVISEGLFWKTLYLEQKTLLSYKCPIYKQVLLYTKKVAVQLSTATLLVYTYFHSC